MINGFTAEQQDQLWEHWRRRDSLRSIARNLGTNTQRVRNFLLQSGGIRLPASKRSDRHLSMADREEISRGIAAGHSAAVIAESLGRAASTVSREIRRNGGRENYRAVSADQRAVLLAKRPKPQRLDVNHMLLIVVAFKLGQDWSPEQISHWLRRTYPEDASMRRARGRNGGRPYKMTPAKLRLAMASMGKPETRVSDLCAELGVTRQTLYLHVSPTGELRPDGEKLLSQ